MTSPKICPVSGMFLEEPNHCYDYWKVEGGDGYGPTTYYHDGGSCKGDFVQGNCFATREDAERYAKHLKAMAKLRRVNGIVGVGRYEWFSITTSLNESKIQQLTPEERNALLWPNEEK